MSASADDKSNLALLAGGLALLLSSRRSSGWTPGATSPSAPPNQIGTFRVPFGIIALVPGGTTTLFPDADGIDFNTVTGSFQNAQVKVVTEGIAAGVGLRVWKSRQSTPFIGLDVLMLSIAYGLGPAASGYTVAPCAVVMNTANQADGFYDSGIVPLALPVGSRVTVLQTYASVGTNATVWGHCEAYYVGVP